MRKSLCTRLQYLMHVHVHEALEGNVTKKIGTLIFRHPRATNPRLFSTPIPIFIGLHDPSRDLRPENWNPCECTGSVFAEMLHRTKRVFQAR